MSGPSGSTHPPVVTLNTAEMFSRSAASAPACSPKNRAPTRYISQVVAAKHTTNGKRTTSPLSLCASFAIAPASQKCSGG